MEKRDEQDDDERQVLAQWLSDKATLDNPKVKGSLPKNGDGNFIDDLEHPEVKKTIVVLNIKNPFNYLKWVMENKTTTQQQIDKEKILLGETYEDIIETLDYWLDIKPEYRTLIAVWVIGTYFHKYFYSYPYLFINAMRGSGKTRLLRLIKEMSNNGELVMSLTDAVLFRSDNNSTMCIDEFEGLGLKEKATLRELLNACYKKGVSVKRMKKSKTQEGEKQVIEEFELYRPLVMANISGMEEVLGDRCITIFLEKSENLGKVLLAENFEQTLHTNKSSLLRSIKTNLKELGVEYVGCRVCRDIEEDWNIYIKNRYETLHNHTYIHTLHNPTQPYTTPYTVLKQEKFFNKIIDTGIFGRHLELFFPLFQLGYFISEDVFDELLKLAKTISQNKKTDEVAESKDVMLYQFVAESLEIFTWYRIKDITSQFKEFINADFREIENINTEWMGFALKRLSLVTEKKRDREGMKVMLDIDKARNKSKMFKRTDEPNRDC